MEIKLLYAYHAGANCKYFEKMLLLLRYYRAMMSSEPSFSYKIVRPPEFKMMDTEDYNVLVYQTFPDADNRKKFDPIAIKELDKIFLDFDGFKILLDSFDEGDCNGYKRFGTAYPRIKHVPSYNYIQKFNVVSTLVTTGWSYNKFLSIPVEIPRTVRIHCAFTTGVYPHQNREKIMEILKIKYHGLTSFLRIPVNYYDEYLRGVCISVVAGGFGETSGSAYPALQSGALLFVQEEISKVKLFPFVDLIDGEDYVSFNLKNFTEKLNWVLCNPKKRNRIRLSGQKKFFEGFDIERSANDFFHYLQENSQRVTGGE